MKRVLFVDQEGKNVFILTKLKKLIIPQKGESVTWSGIYMMVELVEHNYDSETITIHVEI